jgi:hypothetical protein
MQPWVFSVRGQVSPAMSVPTTPLPMMHDDHNPRGGGDDHEDDNNWHPMTS